MGVAHRVAHKVAHKVAHRVAHGLAHGPRPRFCPHPSATVDQVEAAVKHEMEGPGKLLGYRAMYKKLRQVHDLCVPRDLMHAVMYKVDPAALEERTPQFKQKKTEGSLHVQGNRLGTFSRWA